MSPPLGAEATAEAFEAGVVALRSERDVVRVRGPQARSYLQGQCSQDLTLLAPGGAADALVLSAQGKLDALVRIWALAEDDLAVEVAAGFGGALLERLRRFKIRVKADLELDTWPLAQVRGPEAEATTGAEPGLVTGLEAPGGVARLELPWVGVDLVGSTVRLAQDVPEGDPETFEAARIEAGVPAMGRELNERTIPHEAGIVATTVSFTKGCYTGQELVARIDARGARVPRVLRGVVVEGGAAAPRPEVGAALLDGDREVGTLTSVAFSPWRSALVGLCFARREVSPPARLAVALAGGERVGADVRSLPLRATGADEPPAEPAPAGPLGGGPP